MLSTMQSILGNMKALTGKQQQQQQPGQEVLEQRGVELEPLDKLAARAKPPKNRPAAQPSRRLLLVAMQAGLRCLSAAAAADAC